MVAKQEFENWLGRAVDETADEDELKTASSRRRFYSSYLDMIEVCRVEFPRAANLYALAAYAVWRHTPTHMRVPGSQIELARLLGYTNDAVFRKWRERYPPLFTDERTRNIVRSMVLDRIVDVVDASLGCAIAGGAQGFQDRKLLLEIAGVHKPTLDTTVSGESVIHLTWGEAEMDADEGDA